MSNSICTSNLTSGFIDLATYDELEKYMYGGPDATAYFVRQTRKATWFTQVPVCLSRASGTPGFNQEWSVSISRAGDYLLYTWLRFTLPQIVSATRTTPNSNNPNYTLQTFLSWTPNLAHNLVRECCITFNDLVAARFDSFLLDFWSAFTVPGGKQVGYANMIGTTSDLIDPALVLPAKTLNLPLPLFFSRDSGVSLPTAALPYNDMRICFTFRGLYDLLTAWDVQTPVGGGSTIYLPGRPATSADISNTCCTDLTNVQVWANYAIVSNDERKRMACAPRDILIEQVQTAPPQTYNPANTASYDIRFSHAIKVLFFAVQNTTIQSYWSNYTTQSPTVCSASTDGTYLLLSGYFPGSDPIAETSLVYENTQRLANMGSDYFSLVEPYYAAPSIPVYAGYHLYSYSLDFICLDPLGSTNYGKLTNVSINPYASVDAQNASAAVTATTAQSQAVAQTFRFLVTAINNNIIRISGGRSLKPSVPPTVGSPYGCGTTIMEKECNVPLIGCC